MLCKVQKNQSKRDIECIYEYLYFMNYKHLISENKVMVSFSVARRIAPEKLKAIQDKVKKTCKKDSDYDKLVEKEVMKQTQKTLNVNDIPGLMDMNEGVQAKIPKNMGIFKDEKKVMLLNFFGTTVAKKMLDQKLKKDEICFVLLTILGYLGLTDNDFRNFHKRNTQEDSLNEDDEDDESNSDDDETPDY